jgi:CRP-like cAMP-binding protein
MDPKLVRSVPLFADVTPKQRKALAALADEVDVPAGAQLTREGEYAHEFFIILEGEARVTLRRHCTTMGPGHHFGEVGLLAASKRRSATVVAATSMRLLVVASREFATLLHSFPAVAERIYAANAARRMTAA